MLVMLVLFTLTLPLLVLAYVAHSVLAVVVTVMTVLTYWAVNEVARDVEDPFLYEPNGELSSIVGLSEGMTVTDMINTRQCFSPVDIVRRVVI